jgi:hypothetical protein
MLFVQRLVCHLTSYSLIKAFTHRIHTEWQRLCGDWRTFHHDGKISPGWWGWGVHTQRPSLYLPSWTKLQCTRQLRGGDALPLYFISTRYVLCGWGFQWHCQRFLHLYGWQRYGASDVTDNNDIFVASVDDTARKNLEQFVTWSTTKMKIINFLKMFFRNSLTTSLWWQ